ncbi:hypothetical protein SAMN05444364_11141 [Prevotella scopos JCM 17725]|uniref:Uncharacterized protein n=1 Tax=Prevotella scopos JCM 17725 TaxID=1236518 RepID=A0AAX2F3J8_9BACT|nr:hypothetical protein SAMN05444364_11141 [Prevotella scopos JCM 17725]
MESDGDNGVAIVLYLSNLRVPRVATALIHIIAQRVVSFSFL